MKKVVSITLILIMLFCSGVSTAENFSIRNGITFGMAVDEVEKIEAQNGLTDGVYNRDPNLEWSSIRYINKKLLGIDDVILYYFYRGKDNSVFCVKYWGSYKERRDNIYDSLRALLFEKYGTSTYNTENAKLSPFLTDEFNQVIWQYQFDAGVSGTYACDLKWDGWLIEFDDYYVDISFYYYYVKDTFALERSTFELQYTMHSKEEVCDKYSQIQEKKQELLDSI